MAKESTTDIQAYQPLLDLIGLSESGGNYNAYFGHPRNKRLQFTSMRVGEVLQWQDEYVNEGSPSSAVGRYQIINTTLRELIATQAVSEQHLFDESLQDSLAVALIERRGGKEYRQGMLSAGVFGARLSQEWASLPRMQGERPHDSYYQSDGLNRAQVDPHEVLGAIKSICLKD